MSRTKQAKKKSRARAPRRLLALRKRLRKQREYAAAQGAYPNRHFIPVGFVSACGKRMYPVTVPGSPVLGFFTRKVAEEYRRTVRDWRPLHSRTVAR